MVRIMRRFCMFASMWTQIYVCARWSGKKESTKKRVQCTKTNDWKQKNNRKKGKKKYTAYEKKKNYKRTIGKRVQENRRAKTTTWIVNININVCECHTHEPCICMSDRIKKCLKFFSSLKIEILTVKNLFSSITFSCWRHL